MNRHDRRLKRVLLAAGCGTATAFVFAFIPGSWLSRTSDALGIPFGELPVTQYLARHLSLLYGCIGVLFLGLASNVDRYRPMIRLIAAGAVPLGIAQAIIDLQSAMPTYWTIAESVSTVIGGVILYWVATPPGTDRVSQTSD